jgi:peptide/nickel transport system permease protein
MALLSPVKPPPLRRKRRRWELYIPLGWIALLVFLAFTADLLPIAEPNAPVGSPNIPPFSPSALLLGTDSFGRDVGSRLIHGIRISLAVSAGATAIAAALGVLLGLLAAYVRGPLERIISVVIDTLLAFPPLLLLMAIATIIRPGVPTLILTLGVLFIPPFARLARASAISQLQRDYITAARSLGAGHLRILFKEVLPNSIQPVISYSAVVMALVIVIEGSLSFLGVGVPPPAPSWGSMIATGKEHLTRAPFLVVLPSLMICLTVLSFNVVGDSLRGMLTMNREDP